jgi:hypothetical protein
MPTFEEALRNNIKGPPEAYRVADFDLHQEVLQASDATARVTDNAYRLSIVRVGSPTDGAAYVLVLEDTRSLRTTPIDAFLVPMRGYPVFAVGHGGEQIDFRNGASLKDREAIHDYFNELAANPDSELVTRLAMQLVHPNT